LRGRAGELGSFGGGRLGTAGGSEMLRFVAAVALSCVAIGGAASSADERPALRVDAQRLQGTWEGKTKVDLGQDYLLVVEFGKAGTAAVGKYEGTYKVDGSKVNFALTKPKESNLSVSITKLTDEELVWRDEDGQVVAFKKVKADKK
jgi:uncharacterized protein (TIGR03066 family)